MHISRDSLHSGLSYLFFICFTCFLLAAVMNREVFTTLYVGLCCGVTVVALSDQPIRKLLRLPEAFAFFMFFLWIALLTFLNTENYRPISIWFCSYFVGMITMWRFPHRIKYAFLIFGMVLALLCAYAIVFVPQSLYSDDARLRLFMSNPNPFGVLCVTAFMCMYGARFRRKVFIALQYSAMAVIFIALVYSISRAGLWALILALLGSFWLDALLYRKARRIYAICAGILLVAFCLFVSTGIIGEYPKLMRFAGSVGKLVETGEQNPLFSRFAVWDSSLMIIDKSPLTGSGLNSFTIQHKAVTHEQQAYFIEKYGDVIYFNDLIRLTNSHCQYLDIVVTGGVVGLILFMPVLLCGIRYVFYRDKNIQWLGTTLCAFALIFLVESPLFNKTSSALFFCLVGMGAGYALRKRQESAYAER